MTSPTDDRVSDSQPDRPWSPAPTEEPHPPKSEGAIAEKDMRDDISSNEVQDNNGTRENVTRYGARKPSMKEGNLGG